MAGRLFSRRASDWLAADGAARRSRYWLAVMGGGLVGMAAAVLPGLRLSISVAREGYTLYSHPVWSELNFAWGAAPLSRLYLLGAALLVAVGALGLCARRRAVRAGLMALVAALTALAAVHLGTLWDQSKPRWPIPHAGGHGCHFTRGAGIGAEQSDGLDPRRFRCEGAFLEPAIDDLLADTGL